MEAGGDQMSPQKRIRRRDEGITDPKPFQYGADDPTEKRFRAKPNLSNPYRLPHFV
jgi:hypothetical protein